MGEGERERERAREMERGKKDRQTDRQSSVLTASPSEEYEEDWVEEAEGDNEHILMKHG